MAYKKNGSMIASQMLRHMTLLMVVLGAGLNCKAETNQQKSGEVIAADQQSLIQVKRGDPACMPHTQHRDAQWFPEAGLGLFMHPSIISVEGTHEMSWAMLAKVNWNPNPLTPEAYFALADKYDPVNHDPDNWIKAAVAAGFKYGVFVTRHHDGYALWPSKFGNYNTGTHMGGRDLIRPYVEACRKHKMKVGLYYSPWDWHYMIGYMSYGHGTTGTPENPHLGLRHEPITLKTQTEEFNRGFADYLNGQIRELLTNYGKIDFFWFDGSIPGVMSQEEMRKLQPGIVINERQHGVGDFISSKFENVLPQTRPNGWWEHCYSMVGMWAYTRAENCYPSSLLLSRLVRARTWGGNVAANYSPRPDGRMPDTFYQSMHDIKAWMDKNGESIENTKPGPYPEQSNAPVTVKSKVWYVYLLPKTMDGPPFSGPIVVKNVGTPKSVTMLAGRQKLEWKQDGQTVTIEVPDALRTDSVDVVKVSWKQ